MTIRILTLVFVLPVMAFGSALSSRACAGVINGKFEQGSGDSFDGWSTFAPFGSPTEDSDTNRFAVLDEDAGLGGAQLEQEITIPSNAGFLSFDFQLNTTGPSDPAAPVFPVPDDFQATLLDIDNPVEVFPGLEIPPGVLSSGDPIFDPSFFSIDDRLSSRTNPAVSTTTSGPDLRPNWTRVRLDISSLAPQTLLLEFVLLNGTQSDIESSAFLDNVVIAPIPEPASWAVFSFLAAMLGGAKRLGQNFRRRARLVAPLG